MTHPAPKLAAALARVRDVLRANEPRHHDRWRHQSVEAHVAHATLHLEAWRRGDETEPHLDNATCRLLFALELDTEARP
jgi:hypothetical protein